jgi:DHA2 family multidrug resistance protein
MSTEAVAGAPLPATAKLGLSQYLIVLSVMCAVLLEIIDTSIVNVALPSMMGNLGATLDEIDWVITGYIVANVIVIPMTGWLAARFGRTRYFVSSILLFTFASLMCGASQTVEALVCWRVVQGLGGGALLATSQAILMETFPPGRQGMAQALFGVGTMVGPSLGPTLGGWITDHASWRWVFLLNVPVGVLLVFLIMAVISDPPELVADRRRRLRDGIRIDYIGFALLALGLGALQVVLDRGQQDDWFSSGFITAFAIAAGLGLLAFVVWELYQEDPIVDLRLLGQRNFAIANLLMLMLGFVLFGSTVLIPQLVQDLFGYTATLAGLVISPGGFAIMLFLPVVGRLIGTVDVRILITIGLLTCSAALYHLSNFSLDADYGAFMWARLYQTVGLAFLFIPINTVAFVGLPRAKSSLASAIINLSRNIGGSFGISLVVTMLSRQEQRHQDHLVAHVTPLDPIANARIDHLRTLFEQMGHDPLEALRMAEAMVYRTLQDHASMLAYLDDFRLLALIFVALIPFVFLLRKSANGGPPAPAH